jgi:PAS domain S-box-containing protein
MVQRLTYNDLLKRVGELENEVKTARRMKRTLELSEKQYRDLYEGSQDGFVRVALNGKIVEFNSTFRKMLGYSGDELHKKTYQSLTPKKWHALDKKLVKEQVLIKGHSVLFEKEYIRKNGSTFPIELRSYLIRDGRNKPVGIWGFIRDITDRKRIEEELKIKNRNLEEFNAALRIVLKAREHDKSDMEGKMLFNIKSLVSPFLEKLKMTRLDVEQRLYIDCLEASLKEIISPFSQNLSSSFHGLTPAEIQVANLVKLGRTTKEIAELLKISSRTASFH